MICDVGSACCGVHTAVLIITNNYRPRPVSYLCSQIPVGYPQMTAHVGKFSLPLKMECDINRILRRHGFVF